MSGPINDGGPAFPTEEGYRYVPEAGANIMHHYNGMSLRAYIATHAMMGDLANSEEGAWPTSNAHGLAMRAVTFADALIAKLEEGR